MLRRINQGKHFAHLPAHPPDQIVLHCCCNRDPFSPKLPYYILSPGTNQPSRQVRAPGCQCICVTSEVLGGADGGRDWKT